MLINRLILFLFAVLAVAVPITTPAQDSVDASSYWVSSIQRQGTVAFGTDSGYQIYRNVLDFGAKGDGVTDDTAAIQNAVASGNRCGQGCDSSTLTPALVYFPPGTYVVSQPINLYYYTQLVGDAVNPPTLLAASSFTGLAMLDADPYIPGGYGAQWFTNQNNFFRQIRNFVIDMTHMPETQASSGIHWQVAQATSLQNIVFNMAPKSSSNGQVGVFIENGSGGFMSDLTFNGGNIGLNIGNQQFTTRNVQFNGCNTAINMLWDWLWTFKSLTITNCNVGINIAVVNSDNAQAVGSSVVMDSIFQNTPVGIQTAFNANSLPKTGGTLVLYNVDFSGAAKAVADAQGNQILAGGQKVSSWVQGDIYTPNSGSALKRKSQAPVESSYGVESATATASFTDAWTSSVSPASQTSQYTGPVSSLGPNNITVTTSASSSILSSAVPTSSNATTTGTYGIAQPPAATCTSSAVPVSLKSKVQQGLTAPSIPGVLLDGSGNVFQRSRPQYQTVATSSFISVKSAGAKGDGITDDTTAIQNVLNSATSGQIVYFDHGAYVITKTIQVPKNVIITGEVWPVIMVTGSFFSNVNTPQPAFRIGNPGDTGAVEITELIFETQGPAPGAIMMEWNVADSSQGACGMWDTHFRIGGTAGTQLTDSNCKANSSTSFVEQCAGSFLMLHVTQQASLYLENTWFWLADHDLDSSSHSQVTIFNGRGVLIESQGPTWLYGTAVEHNVLYNYQFANAQNVFMGAIQTETAYYQSAPDALASGFTPNAAYSDPTFSTCTTEACKKTWGLRTVNSENIYMFGGGLYSFYDDYVQDCLDPEDCQTNMVSIECSSDIYLYGLVTKAATNQVVVNGNPVVLQSDNTNLFGSTVALFEQL